MLYDDRNAAITRHNVLSKIPKRREFLLNVWKFLSDEPNGGYAGREMLRGAYR